MREIVSGSAGFCNGTSTMGAAVSPSGQAGHWLLDYCSRSNSSRATGAASPRHDHVPSSVRGVHANTAKQQQKGPPTTQPDSKRK
jgi:hypothetical protein